MKIETLIKELRYVPAAELTPNPENWRTHPRSQVAALKDSISAVGYAVPIIARELPDGTLRIVDGHLRAETVDDEPVPVIVLDLTDEQERLLLATIDPMAGAAQANANKLEELLGSLATDNPALATDLPDLDGLLQKLAADVGISRLDPYADWEGMPEFEQEDVDDFQVIKVHLASKEAQEDFKRKLGVEFGDTRTWLHYPPRPHLPFGELALADEESTE